LNFFLIGHEMDIEVLIQNNEPKLILISDNFPPLEPSFYEQGRIVSRPKFSTKMSCLCLIFYNINSTLNGCN